MSNEYIIQPKSLGGFVRAVSGLFITKDNPNGLTEKECLIISCLLSILMESRTLIITKEIKEKLANELNQNSQVTVNYLNKLKKKEVITKDNKLRSVFYKNKITIEWNV